MISKLEHARILVTGGAGFIGSNLVETLLAKNNEVVCLDNFLTGKRENIAKFLDNRSFRLIEGDIRSIEVCRNAVDGVDYVLHEAALGSVPRSVADPMTTTDINISGFVNMLCAAKDAHVKRFVYAASSSVYGDSRELPKVENRIGKQLSPYAISKYVNELYAENFASLYGMEVIGLRYFNVYGRRQNPSGAYAAVIPKFADSLIRHEPPVINGDGSYSRDFTYVDDVVQANMLALLTQSPESLNTVYNIAGGGRTTLNELVASLKSALSAFDPSIADIESVYGPERKGDIPHSLADISKAARLLGYAPRFKFADGIRAAAEWYFSNR